MNKKLMIAVCLVVVLVGAGIVLLSGKSDTKTSNNSSSSTKTTGNFKVVDACKTLTQKDAVTLLGEGATAGANAGDTSTDDINVSTCSYILSSKTASLLARSAKTDAGAKSNEAQFTSLPSGAISVEGYGDKAYWDPAYGQFNILKNKNWYILSYGPVRVTEKTIEDGKKIADLLVSKL